MNNRLLKSINRALVLIAATASAYGATDLATAPLVTSSTASVLPNILYVLDDSGSMNWDFMPDWACASYSVSNSSCNSTGEDPSSARAEYLFRNSGYNGVYYNPAITYTPPTYYNADGTANTTTYPDLSGQSSTTGGDATATSAAPNWNAVKNDGYGVQLTGTSNLSTANNYFYTFVAREWCNSINQTACQATKTGAYVIPATLRWCSSSTNSTAATPAANSCQLLFNSSSGRTWARAPSPNLATITMSGTSSTSVSSIKVNNQEILSAATTASTSATTVAAAIASNINNCKAALTGSCQVSGYTAYAAAGVVTIAAPLPANITYTPAITKSGSMTATATAFSVGTVPGSNLLTVITPDINSYPYPGTSAKASTRTDCAGTTCTYVEEMSNYANWYAYYRTRMQMVKTSISQAFSSIGSTYRVGYMTLNNNHGTDFVNNQQFTAANKLAWYNKFFLAKPNNSTPLRVALAQAGKYYANKAGSSINGVATTDPMQYSCQQNFTILSTDGYWNESSTPTQLDGSTAIDNQDASEPRPYNDGGATTYNMSTSQLQLSQTQMQLSTSQIQSRTTQIQSSTSTLQSNTGTLQQRTGPLQWQTTQQMTTAPLQWTTNLQKTTAPLQWTTNLQKTTAPLQWTTNLQKTTAPLQWTTNLQKTTAPLQWTTNLQKTTAQLRISNATYTVTTYALQISSNGTSGWGQAGKNTTYTCITTGTGSGSNQYCRTTGTASTATHQTSCSVTYNNPGTSTSDSNRSVVTACTPDGWSTATAVGANGTCNASSTVQCSTTSSSTSYVATYPPTCAINYNSGGANTADASGNVVTACPTSTYNTTKTAVGAGGSCDGSLANVQCSTGTTSSNYVATYPPTCAINYNSGGANTADASGNVVTACPTSTYNTTKTAVGAGGSCNGSLANVQCSTGTTSSNYVATYPPTCAINYNSGGANTADASGNVVTACPTSTYNTTKTAVGAGGSCNGSLANVQCSTGTTSSNYVATYPPTCAINYSSGGANTADASGNVVTACPTSTYNTTKTAVGASGSCNGSLANVQCSTGTASSNYVATYPPTCAINYSSGGANTADASGNVVTACPTSTYNTTKTAVGASGSCNGSLANVQCSTGTASSNYVATYPPTCAINYSSGGANTADASGNVVTACPVAGTYSGWTNVGSGGSCTPSATVNCQYNWGGWSNASSCTANYNSGAGTWNITSGTNCQYSWAGLVNASSCTAVAADTGPTYSVGTARQCSYTTWTSWANASSCSAVAQSSASPYTVGTARQCQTTDTGWVGATSCTAGSSGGATTTCQSTTTGPTPVASCTAQTANAGNSWVQQTCNNAVISPAVGVLSCTADAPTAANNYVSTNCTTVTTGPSSTASCTAASPTSSNNYTTTTCVATSTSGGTSNTLADVAEYYYKTDLRNSSLNNCTGNGGNDVCSDNVPASGQDGASWQHMTTFTLGLGASGNMQFSPSYATATSGDYYSVKNGVTADPTNGVCSWQSSGSTCNWPSPVSNTQTTIDDLWHAGVNGRGSYFSATDPTSLATGLGNALAGVSARLGASAAATTSNPNVTSGDNFVFSSTFTTNEWAGQLFRQQIDLTTGAVPTFVLTNTSTYDWEAQTQLDSNSSRTFYTYAPTATNKLKPLTWATLTSGEQSYFNTPNISSLSQFCAAGVTCLSAAAQTAAAGSNLLAFIEGDRTNEGASTDTSKYYRQRAHILGDIVNAEAVYVKSSLFQYADANYLSTTDGTTPFATANASRQGMVYAASNDGMLHAFNATTGVEAWAHVPALVLPNLYQLADKNYTTQHQYFVDGTPIASDICPNAPATTCAANEWKTILVGGLNRGGRGYYALDVTDPTSPKALWEFTDTNMGYTYGNPEITKLVDGTWVVLVTSGYNNISPGDGVGRLYVLNAATGALIRTISTGVGDTTNPSGLARIRAWADDAMSDNTAQRVYGGDLLGNLWRFDINDNVGASGYEAQLLATFYGNGATRQPITTKPELGLCGSVPVVFAGTGRYLGASDLSDTSVQSFYAVKDQLGTAALTPFNNPRGSGSGFINQTMTVTTCPSGTPTTICATGEAVRVASSNVVNFATDNGWYIDLPDSGERDNTDPALALGTLAFNTNTPNVSACTAGGYSNRYFLNYCTGSAVLTSTTKVVGVRLGNALATRAVFVKLPNNTVVQLTRMSDGSTKTTNVPIGSGSVSTRRVSWRELVGE